MEIEHRKNFFPLFLRSIIAIYRTITVVWTAIDSITENFFLQPLAIKSKTSAYMEHLLQNVVDFALITKAFM